MKNKIQWLILLLGDEVDVIHWFSLPVAGTENASIQGCEKPVISKMCRVQKVNDRKDEWNRCFSFMCLKLKTPKKRLATLTSFAHSDSGFYFWKKRMSLRCLICLRQPQYIHKVLKVTPNVSYSGSRTQIRNSL